MRAFGYGILFLIREEQEKQRAQGMQAFAALVKSAEHYDLQITHATRWQDVGMRLADIARADSTMQGERVGPGDKQSCATCAFLQC